MNDEQFRAEVIARLIATQTVVASLAKRAAQADPSFRREVENALIAETTGLGGMLAGQVQSFGRAMVWAYSDNE